MVRKRKPEVIRISEYRKQSGKNQTDFWATFGVKQSCGSRYENGWRIPAPLALLLVLRQQGVISDADLERARKVVAGSAIA